MQFLKVLNVMIIITIFTILFHKAAGSLDLKNLNMLSGIYYTILIFSLIGASLIYLGFRQHYMIRLNNVTDAEINQTYLFLAYTVMVFPTVLILMQSLFNKRFHGRSFKETVHSPAVYPQDLNLIKRVSVILLLICLAATVYVFICLGYVPLIHMLHTTEDLNFLRQSASRYFTGNQYIKNLLMYTLTPYVSYYIYIYFRLTKERFWKILFILSCLLTVNALTYDYSKSPIIIYFLGLYFIEVMLGNIKNYKTFNRWVAACIIFLIFMYVIVYDQSSMLFSIYKGPIGRILFTQISTLFLHVQAFPAKHAFLLGASFPKWMSFFIPAASGLRSGRVVMEIYNPEGIANQTAGVMNSIFTGEAYANFGITGVIFAPVIFGVVIGFFAYFLQSREKRPAIVLLYAKLSLSFITLVEGGFVDIFYNAASIFLILIAAFLLTMEKRSGTSAPMTGEAAVE